MAEDGCTGACCSNDVKKHRLCKHRDRNKSPDVGVFRSCSILLPPPIQACLLAHTLFRLRTNADVSLFCWSETRWISNVAFSTPLSSRPPHYSIFSPPQYPILSLFYSITCLRSIFRSINRINFFHILLVNIFIEKKKNILLRIEAYIQPINSNPPLDETR